MQHHQTDPDPFFAVGAADKKVIARDVYGQPRTVTANQLHFRPGAYGVLIRDEAVLLEFIPQFQLWTLPGGGIELGELNEAAVQREFREETGLAVKVGELIEVETAFYADPKGVAHSLLFYYRVELADPNQEIKFDFDNGNDTQGLQWVPLTKIATTKIGFVYQHFLLRNFAKE